METHGQSYLSYASPEPMVSDNGCSTGDSFNLVGANFFMECSFLHICGDVISWMHETNSLKFVFVEDVNLSGLATHEYHKN